MAKDVKKEKDIKKDKKKKDTKKKEEIEEVVKVDKKKEKEIKKEEKKKTNSNSGFSNFVKSIDDNRVAIILFIVGFLIATLIFRCILWPDRIATLADGKQPILEVDGNKITADDLYEDMKKYYSINVLVNTIDDMILSKKYPSDSDMESNVSSTADYYYSAYESNYGYTKEQFLSQYGFASEKDFYDDLRLDYRRNLYYTEYVLDTITDKEVNKYYEDEVFGDVDSKHILVSIDEKDGLSDSEAKALANEIISKLNGGTSWEDVIKEYKEKIISEELGYKAFNASLESAYLKECKNLAVGTYSKTPVLTSYGYHIVYKIDQKDKPELKDVEDAIKELLVAQKKNSDSNLYYKALISMRNDAKLKFSDTKFEEEYNTYIAKYK